MVKEPKSREGSATNKKVWYDKIKSVIELQKDNEHLNSTTTCLPIGLLIKTDKQAQRFTFKDANITGLKFGWHEDNPGLIPVYVVEFINETHPVFGKNMRFELELFPWDGSTFKKTESGVTHTLKNRRGNVVLRQTVASEKALPVMLNKFLKYCSKFLINHCEIPTTIKI